MAISTEDFFYSATVQKLVLAVSMGQAPGYSVVNKYGINPEITTISDPEDVWQFGGSYPYDADNTAPILYVSSSSSADVGQIINIQGLDIDGNFISQDVTLTGQTNVLLDTPLWRVFRMQNNADITGQNEGIIYVHTDIAPTAGVPLAANVRSIISGSAAGEEPNQTLMAIFTIPLRKVAFLYKREVGVELDGNAAALAEYAHCHYEQRSFGKLFKVKKAVTVFTANIYQDELPFPSPISALTDLRLRVIRVTQTMGMWGTFDLLLVDEDKFSDEYLQSIGQPGY